MMLIRVPITNTRAGFPAGDCPGCIAAIFLSVALLWGSPAAGQNSSSPDREKPRFELEEVVVTASGLEDEIEQMPKNVTVITREDIAQAPSDNVAELLSREANVNLQSLYGHDKDAGIDIRGQGSTAASNVLVLVDGFRLNPPDLSGPDISSVPLDQIERIEILRGAGSVLYGDGAVGGVVNIITKKPTRPLSGEVFGSYGSYDAFNGRAAVEGAKNDLRYSLNTGYSDADGYRDNGYYRRSDIRVEVGRDLGRHAASLSAFYKEDAQGFPGGVPKADKDDRERRRDTRSPGDFGQGVEMRVAGSFDADLSDWGALTVKGRYRSRESDFVLGYTSLKGIEAQKSLIDEESVSADIALETPYALFDREQVVRTGVDAYYTDYVTRRPDQLVRKNSRIKSIGVFALNRGDLLPKLTYTLGARYNTYRGKFRNDDLKSFAGGVQRWINADPFERDWENTAVEAGLVYSHDAKTTFFANYATSFRIPNVDEMALAVGELEPQEGRHFDVGIRRLVADIAEASLTFFHIVTRNEIFFDNLNNVNDNYEDDTRRQGVEFDVRLYPTADLYLWGNFTLMSAKFAEKDTTVPLVPEFTAALGGEWRIFEDLVLSLTGTHVGSKYDGNDLENRGYDKIDSYTVFDGKITYSFTEAEIFFGINNLFDTLYETTAFSETYYTMPTRNVYGGVRWTF